MRRVQWISSFLLAACNPSGDRDDTGQSATLTSAGTSSTSSTSGSTGAPTSTSGDPSTSSTAGSSSSSGVVVSSSTGGPSFDLGPGNDLPAEDLPAPQLWYSIEDTLVYVELNPLDGSVVKLVASSINNNPTLAGGINSCGLTMLPDGSLLGSRGYYVGTRMFHIPAPPTVESAIDVDILGIIPGELYVEALHTDCEGRVYLMDTGVDNTNNIGNRLLRFKGDFLAGDFAYDVITDLQTAVSVDIDDMAPGIDMTGKIRDNPGFGIDSGMVYALDYTDGTGVLLGAAGTYGIHALGGPLFDDGVSRLYVLDIDAQLFQANPATLALSPVLTTGPALMSGNPPGNTGLAGPLTKCTTGFPPG